jgi:mono/diheme cytochrome c family protein
MILSRSRSPLIARNGGGSSTSDGGLNADGGVKSREQKVAALAGVAANGASLYLTKGNCGSCHGADGKTPTNGSFPSLKEPSASDPVDELAGYILNGKGTGMPACATKFTDQEVADLVAWMKANIK